MRILIYRLGSLGDTVLALPCFHLIRQTYPQTEITVLTNAPVSGKAAPLEAILASTGLIDRAIHYPLGLRDPRALLALARRIRAEKFDLLISLAAARGRISSWRDTLFFWACGLRHRIGIPFRCEDLVCSPTPDGSLFESEAVRLLRRVSSLGKVDLRDRSWLDLKLTPQERSEAALLLEPVPGRFMAASLGTKSPLNDWGQEKWTALLQGLSQAHPELGLVLLGSPDERERSQQLLKGWAGPSLNLCGMTSPRISAGVLEKAALFLGHDSGPMHLAAASGAPCVAIFSARCPPGQWFPLGNGHLPLYPLAFYDPAKTTDASHQRAALASIEGEVVQAAIESCLRRP